MPRIQQHRAPIDTQGRRNNVTRNAGQREALLAFGLILGSCWAVGQQVHVVPRANSSAALTHLQKPLPLFLEVHFASRLIWYWFR